VISSREALALGFALALNNVGTGAGAGVAGVSPLATTLLAGTLSLICIGGGSRLGWSLGSLVLGRWASLISGLILLSTGTAALSGVG
jgi:putative Mn2+ efflux pump MntP